MVRLRVGFLVIAMAMSLFGARLVQLQAIDPGAYAEMAFAEGVQEVVLPAERGAIKDRNGYELATSMDGLMVVADPKLTREYAGQLATFLADRLDVDYFQTLSRLRKEGEGSRFQYIARRVPASVAQKAVDEAEERGWKGLTTQRDPIRAYPADDVAANIIGFIGQDEDKGPLAGVERTFDEVLAGVDGMARYQTGAGAKIPLGENTVVKPRDGEDLSLTIDSDTQFFVQRVIGKAVRRARADSGSAVVMDTRTGDLLAWADYPTFDANNPQESPEEDLGSRGVQDVYEPGSVQKVLTMAALVNEGMSPHTRLEVPSKLPGRQGATIHDHFDHGLLRLTLTGVLAKSSNIGTVLAAEKLASEQLHGYLDAFGLGQGTDIGARGESRGLLPEGSLWSSLQHDTIAFGQGLGVTAVQMAAAVNTIANGGTYVSPSLVQGSATTDGGLEVGTDHKTTRRVVSEQAAHEVSMMMEKVLDPEDGVGAMAQVPGYRVAGKTGTAQVAEGGRYVEGKFDVSFAGFAPADDPRFTVYIVIHNPRNGMGGGFNAGPAFARIMAYLLRHYSVPPTGTDPSDYRAEWGPEADE